MNLQFTKGKDHLIYPAALSIRFQVFVEEQGVDPQIELDQWDDQAYHFVGFKSDQAVTTGRLIEEDEDRYHLTRLATVKSFRRQSYGRHLLTFIEEQASQFGGEKIWLSAQDQAIPFYKALGYQLASPGYQEAGIAHHRMEKQLLS